MASSMFSSDTVTTSSTRALMISPVRRPGRGTAMPSAMVGPPTWARCRPAGPPSPRSARSPPPPARCRGQVAGGHRHARQQAAPAHRDHQRVEVGVVGQHLEGAGALAGDDVGVVEGVDVGAALGLHQPDGLGLRAGQVVARQHDGGAQLPGALHLHERRPPGHHDGGGDAEPGGVVGDRLGVVAGGHGHHAPGPLVGGEQQQPVEGPPLLEGGDELEVLELHDDRAPEHLRQRPGWVLGVRSIAPAMRSAAAVTSSR